MRAALGLPDNIVPKTIRHTIATQLRSRRVPMEEISTIFGHSYRNSMTGVYAKYHPDYLKEAMIVLAEIFDEIVVAADKWLAMYERTKNGNGPVEIIARRGNRPG